ncbi:hypothetical protein [Brytella acorum]|uniref:Uncharacterized protein n=1 Tax=Brytella acorum TaxID=2959299 RepID=A0AA35UTS3_9PROT|nr:hypothetical protein [Brytella acorum]CAI9121949.1 hypothetical protein LMG32879_002805 [Brytella acorum]
MRSASMNAAQVAGRYTDLPDTEKALLWCIRAWVISLSGRPHLIERIDTTFESLGASEGAAELYGLMATVARGARRFIEINCVCYPHVGMDERRLLDALAFQQHGRHEDAFDILTDLLSTEAALTACDYLIRLAVTLSAAGHASGLSGQAVHSFARSNGTAAPGSYTLH